MTTCHPCIALSRPTLRTLFLALALGALLASCGQVSVTDPFPMQDVGLDVSVDDVPVETPDALATDSTQAQPDVPEGVACEDDAACVIAILGQTPCKRSKCVKGLCTDPLPLEVGTECSMPSLTVSKCQFAACDAEANCSVQNKEEGAECGLGACGEVCLGGVCVQAPANHYEDDNPCTNVTCDQGVAIKVEKLTNLSISCDDNNPCTTSDACIVGQCAGQLTDCDDGVPCTKDECHPTEGCKHVPDNSACKGDDPCVNLACSVTVGCAVDPDKPYNEGAPCEDNDECTPKSACDAKGGCGGTSTCACENDAGCLKEQTDACTPLKCVNKLCEPDPDKKIVCDTGDDGPCAKTACDPKSGTCETKAIEEGKDCDDQNKCTSKSVCKAGVCTGPKDKKCDDGLACTLDSCDPALGCAFEPGDGNCDDTNSCTENDTCIDGACKGTPLACDDGVDCTYDKCDPKTGQCVNELKDAGCDDGNPCTDDKCDATKDCQNPPKVGAKCEDGDKCTEAACGKSGKCDQVTKYLKEVPGCGCQSDSECESPSACVVATCKAGDCVFDKTKLNGSACETGDKCHVANSGKCDAGACTGGKPKDCAGQGDACNVGSCAPSTGQCVTTKKADGTTCDADGDKCTEKDTCQAGKCVADSPKDCSALTQGCKEGACDKASGKCVAQNVKDGEGCDDGDFCSALDACKAGVCTPGPSKTCNEVADACNTGKCDSAAKKCVAVPKASGTACDDGQYCNEGEACDGKGKCAGGKLKACVDDVKGCKTGACDEAGNKCVLKTAANGVACDDGNKCTQTDTCASGSCKGSSPKNCDASSDACNTGVCQSATGACAKTPKATGTACNDGDDCTLSDKCASGVCKPGTPKNCNDNNACTLGDTCVGGACKSGTPKNCDDNNACTADACNTSTGACTHTSIVGCGGYCTSSSQCKPDTNPCTDTQCVSNKCTHVNNTANCEDGNLCTLSDKCSLGTCKPGSAKVCAAKTCQTVSCVPSNGSCSYKITAGAPCNDGLACTYSDVCDTKANCSGKPTVCNDGNGCTNDSCNTSTGKCQYLNNTVPCSDGNACTLNDVCYLGKCKPGAAKNCADSTKCTTDTCSTKTGACSHTAAYEGSVCEKGSYSLCQSGTCGCKLYEKTDGGTSSTDYLYSVVPVSDGGVIAVGRSYTGSSYDGWITRRDSVGKLIWSKKIYGGSSTDELRSVVLTTAKTYLAAGYSYDTTNNNYCGWVVEFDINGYTKKSFKICQGVKNDYLFGLVMDKTGAFYAAGTTYSSGNTSYAAGWLVRINLGNIKGGYVDWKKSYDAFSISYPIKFTYYNQGFNALAYDSATNLVYAAGYTSKVKYGGTQDGLIMALDTAGAAKWSGLYGGANADSFNAIVVNPYYTSKYLYAAGVTYVDSSWQNNAWLVRAYTSSGAQVSTSNYGSKVSGTSAWNGIENYSTGVQVVGTNWDGKTRRGWMMRASSSCTKISERLFSANSDLYGITTNSGLWQSVGRVLGAGYDGLAVQSDYAGNTTCK